MLYLNFDFSKDSSLKFASYIGSEFNKESGLKLVAALADSLLKNFNAKTNWSAYDLGFYNYQSSQEVIPNFPIEEHEIHDNYQYIDSKKCQYGKFPQSIVFGETVKASLAALPGSQDAKNLYFDSDNDGQLERYLVAESLNQCKADDGSKITKDINYFKYEPIV